MLSIRLAFVLRPGSSDGIVKAVAALNAQDRRTIYGRGRNVLLTELEAVSPPLRKSIINKELLAFEEAICKVEAEMARRARES